MDHPYENLDPERFQQFCQALIAKDYPNIQCIPVAQPDGGRDSLSYLGNNDKYILFQVKFVRTQKYNEHPIEWLKEILTKELPKVNKQVLKGAKEYIIITNQKGTAHPNSGTIQKANELLKKYVPIPAYCMWRDELNIKLDNAWGIKWVYPELMSGVDFIHLLVEQNKSADNNRRAKAIHAFVQEQFQSEEQLKFKQIELQNNLMELFVDVPISFTQRSTLHETQNSLNLLFRDIEYDCLISSEFSNSGNVRKPLHYNSNFVQPSFLFEKEGSTFGAATMLLHHALQKIVPYAVIEGAPGQGKSTITQYVCQVHRLRLLNKKEEILKLPKMHRESPVRLPIKLDIRDLSVWLAGKNPFLPEKPNELPENWIKSLESFLAALISFHSGGQNFTVDDFVAILSDTPVILVFDGLDEVADINTRQDVVSQIVNGVKRLQSNSGDVQVVITSRPTAFVSSPSFPSDEFIHFHLEALTKPLITEYATKWLIAKRCNAKESIDIHRILSEKLDQPHLRDLARNPMQLAILLSLIHTRGSSLPDKRTALYDSYMETFFSRETEKSAIVREYRDLLINIHRYLAWVLHTQAEAGNTSGSVTADGLLKLVQEYLVAEGYESSIAKQLFTGMVERVVALVSRVQGTYEFEVQPLREYFAARYLYDTAPYSPPGNEKKGTKPDRFDAMVRNFYWLNVTRFYAGCYSKGELPSLASSLKELISDENYGLLSYPAVIIATLLADWVFSQSPKLVKEVVQFILQGNGPYYLLNTNNQINTSNDTIALPLQCGNQELVNHCFDLLGTTIKDDQISQLAILINSNCSPEIRYNLWRTRLLSNKGLHRTRLFNIGTHLATLRIAPFEDLSLFFSDNIDWEKRVQSLVLSGRLDYFQRDSSSIDRVVDQLLSRRGFSNRLTFFAIEQDKLNTLDVFAFLTNPVLYYLMTQGDSRYILTSRNLQKISKQFLPKRKESHSSESRQESNCIEFINTILPSLNRSRTWMNSLDNWNVLVETGRRFWGDRWVFYCIASISASITSKSATCKDCSNLFDQKTSLSNRVRYARLHSVNRVWWIQQSQFVHSISDTMFFLLVLFTWGSSLSVSSLSQWINQKIKSLSDENYEQLYNALSTSLRASNRTFTSNAVIGLINKGELHPKTVNLFYLRADSEARVILFDKYFRNYKGSDLPVLESVQQMAFKRLLDHPKTSQLSLELIRRTYSQGALCHELFQHGIIGKNWETKISLEIAKQISSHPSDYPLFLFSLAENICKTTVASKNTPLQTIATRESWFQQ